jgi:FkbM family methyltransferase
MNQLKQSDEEAFYNFENRCRSIGHQPKSKIDIEKPIYIFGAGRFGRSLLMALKKRHYQVRGFIETDSPKKKIVDDIPVFSWEELNKDDLKGQLLVGIYNRDDSLNNLKNIAILAGFQKILMPWDFYSDLSSELGWQYWLSSPQVIFENLGKIKSVYELLSDNESKKTLLKICEFRLGIADSFANFQHQDNQYFNDLTLNTIANRGEYIYVDCGAYTGDTFVEALKELPITSAYLFEPDSYNFSKLVSKVKKTKIPSVCFPLAVTNKHELLAFQGESEAGAIVSGGAVRIATAALDEVFSNSMVDFIKFDIEGSEMLGIEGAKNLIKRTRPTLALSLYHRPADLWELPALISGYCSNYRFYIRQHFKNSFDSVLYAIPS